MRKHDQFEERPRKVHYFFDQKGAKLPHSNKPFGNTLCKINSNSPEMLTTDDPNKVTCKLCRQHGAFKHILNAQYGKFNRVEVDYDHVVPKEQAERIAKVVAPHYQQQFGRILRPNTLNGKPIRYRRSLFGKMVLQVQEMKPYNYDPVTDLEPGGYTGVWRDATLDDFNLGHQ